MTDKHIPASKLLDFISDELKGIDKTETECDEGWWETSTGAKFGESVISKLRALIDAEPERIPLCNLWVNPDNLNYEVDHCEHPLDELIPVYASPPADNLIAELVEALEDANKKIRKAKDFEYEAQEHISESSYELNGFLGSVAAEISVNWQKTIDRNDALLKRAKEAIK